MAVVHSPAIKPHQHVAGREHEDDHRHEHEDDGLRLSVAAERLIEGPLNTHVPPPFIIAIAPSKHNSVHLRCLCNFDGKRTEADRLHVGRRHGGPQTTDHDQKEEFVDAFSVVFDVEASGFTSDASCGASWWA